MFKTMSNYYYKKLMNYEQIEGELSLRNSPKFPSKMEIKFGHEKKKENESVSSILVLQAVCLRLISRFQNSFHKVLYFGASFYESRLN